MCPAPMKQESEPDLPTSSSAAAVLPTLDVLYCNASELAQYLLQHRFQEPDQAAKFLQAALTKAKSHDAPQAPDPEDLDMGDILTTSPSEISLVTPRAGKFQLAVHQKGLVAIKSNNEAIQMVIPQGCVTHILFFPKPEDFKVTGGNNSKKPPTSDLVLMCLEPPVIFQNKPVSQICIQLPWEKTQGALGPSNETSLTEDATSSWLQLLTQSLGSSQTVVSRVVRQKGGNSFSSFQMADTSTTTAGMPFVKCYHGVQDGVLYPLEEGLLFFKPPRFIPRSQLHSIACGRGSSSTNSSRYVDMILQLQDDSTIEFSNIQREELVVLNEYIHKVLIPAMQQDASSGSKNKADDDSEKSDKEDEPDAVQAEEEEEADHDSETSDDDDEDFDMHSDHHDSENESDSEDEDGDSSDDGGGVEVVEDDFVKELAKKKNADSATESEEEEGKPRSKRCRRG